MTGSKAYKGGHADGIFKRPQFNPYTPYSQSWSEYNIGYIDGYEANIDTSNLKGVGYGSRQNAGCGNGGQSYGNIRAGFPG